MNLGPIHHVALWASDLEKAKDFYVRKLGFALLRETARPDKGDVKLDLQLEGAELEVFCASGHPPRPSYPEALGLRHLAFAVVDVRETVAQLAAVGIPAEPVRIDPITGRLMTFFFDPDGQPLELHE
ncbi:MAG: VOC family protein [Clostridiales bacterium]|nr:VOC family protein [Clostridiales bacterium]